MSGQSRRGATRIALGGGLAVLGLVVRPDAVSACRNDGRRCGKGRNGNCCSGTCKRGTCRAKRGAAGCTVRFDVCSDTGSTLACPTKPGAVCVVLDNGKPFCASDIDCFRCQTDDDCTELAGGTAGKCITTCALCAENSNRRACVYAVRPPALAGRSPAAP